MDDKIKCKHCGTEVSTDILMQKQGHINTCPVCKEFFEDTIVCADCGTSFSSKVLLEENGCSECLVCGKKFELGMPEKESELKTWYYYDSGTITTTLYNHRQPVYTFQAKDLSEAEEKLKELNPDAFQPTSQPTQVKCPYCGSTQVQLVPRKWSLLMGIMTNKVDRTCLNCQRTF